MPVDPLADEMPVDPLAGGCLCGGVTVLIECHHEGSYPTLLVAHGLDVKGKYAWMSYIIIVYNGLFG